jgi:hypothetical protein
MQYVWFEVEVSKYFADGLDDETDQIFWPFDIRMRLQKRIRPMNVTVHHEI